MDGKVIPIQGRLGLNRGKTPEERAARAEQQAADIQHTKHITILKKMKDSPMMRKPSERLPVANNLWEILTDLENSATSVSKKEVLHAADQGSGADSTKRLPYFAVNPELSKEEQDKRASKLTQHILRYVKIVEAAARLGGGNEKVLIERLVEGTSYSSSPGDPENVEDLTLEGWIAIEDALREVSKEITRKHDLQRFFSRVRELGIGVDSEDNFIQPAGRCEIYAAFEKQALPALTRTDDLPPRPSVYLGEVSAGNLPCNVRLEPYDGDGEARDELFDRLEDSGLKIVNFKAIASPVLKCWLELVPLRKESIVTPVLRVASRTLIRAAQSFDRFVAFGGASFTEGETIYTADGYYNDDGSLEDFGDLIPAAIDEHRNSYAYYELSANLDRDADDAYRKSLHAQIPFDHSLVGRLDDSARACLLNPTFPADRKYCAATAKKMSELGLGDADTASLTLFPGGTMAASLHRSLFDAREPASLRWLLGERAGALAVKLTVAIDGLRARRQFAQLHIE
jgi:hypothetical protein